MNWDPSYHRYPSPGPGPTLVDQAFEALIEKRVRKWDKRRSRWTRTVYLYRADDLVVMDRGFTDGPVDPHNGYGV